jgi:endonuclease YncB( thermonuclease family)
MPLSTVSTLTSAVAQACIPATLTSAVDGGTVRVQPEGGYILTVPLIGIDTPETKHLSKPVQCYGIEASSKTAEVPPAGTGVELEIDVQDRNRYGRALTYVWREGGMLMVNEQPVAEGYALTLTITPNVSSGFPSHAAPGGDPSAPLGWLGAATASAGAEKHSGSAQRRRSLRR